MIITEIQYFFSKIIRFQAIFKDTVEFTCALEFKISSQHFLTWNNYIKPKIRFDFQEILSKQNDALLIST